MFSVEKSVLICPVTESFCKILKKVKRYHMISYDITIECDLVIKLFLLGQLYSYILQS